MSSSKPKKTISCILISLLITIVIGFVWFYVSLPAINLHNTNFYSFALILLLVYILVFMITLGVEHSTEEYTGSGRLREYFSFAKNQCKLVLILVIALLATLVVGQVLSAPILRASAYHNLLDVQTGNFTTDIDEVSFDEIPMLDESSARRLGDRKLGELSDMVSQFEVAYDYTQINYQGRPVRVASLEYGDFFKWIINTKEGLPAYITVDMVTQEAQVVRLSEGMRYSPSEYFNRDLMRALRFRYPTFMFSSPHLELDDKGQPWWVCPRETRTIGLFGGSDIIGAVLLNACTGEHVYYDVKDIPTWVDRVYTATLITQQYDYYGTYIQGFINSLIGQKNVTVTTADFNYLAMNDDVYMYTGITSVSSDQSNIGFLLSNQRTKETTYYAAPGAIESSAMDSAQGVVQDLQYTSTFPLLLNISGQPTYFMSLKDSSDLVKMYAMVNVSQYQIVATGTTVAACESDYIAKLQQNNISTNTNAEEIVDPSSVSGTIAEIRSAVLEGNSWYYIRLNGEDGFYAIAASKDQQVVILNVGDAVTLQVDPNGTGSIINAYSIAAGDQRPDAESPQPTETEAPPETNSKP